MRGLIERAAANVEAEADGPGPVILALDNSPELIVLVLACLVAGRPFCIVSADRAATFLPAVAGPGGVLRPSLVVASASVGSAWRIVEPDVLIDRPATLGGLPVRDRSPDRLVYLQPTSGSSGVPKLVPVTERMLIAQLQGISDRSG